MTGVFTAALQYTRIAPLSVATADWSDRDFELSNSVKYSRVRGGNTHVEPFTPNTGNNNHAGLLM